jgi:glycosyltransferase involved in cell wall biosynthesis
MHSPHTSADQKFRLLIFSHYFGPRAGGAEMQVFSLASGISRHTLTGAPQFEITVVSGVDDEYPEESKLPFAVVRRPGFYQLWQLIRSADVVHLAGPLLIPLLVATLQRKRIVVEHHGYQAICPNGILVHQPERSVCPGYFQAKKYVECMRCQAHELSLFKSVVNVLSTIPRYLLAKKVAANVAITDYVLDRHSLPRSERIYYGTPDRFSETHPASKSVPASRKTCIAFVGRFVPEKGIPVLLDAVSVLKNEGLHFSLRLVGDGPQRAELEAIVATKALNDCVEISGHVSQKAMTEALQDVSVIVIPSLWEEAAGLVAIEQMMNGRVVVASAIGGLKEIVGDGGLLFPTGDANALAAVIKELLQNRDLMESVSIRARARAVRLFDLDRMTNDHIRLYLRLAQPGRN